MNITTLFHDLMKYLQTLFVLIFIPLLVHGQSVSVSPVSGHSSNQPNVFPTHNGTVTVSSNNIRIQAIGNTEDIGGLETWALSPRGYKFAAMTALPDFSLQQVNYTGEVISRTEFEFIEANDETVSVYPFDDGRAIVKDNVANFTFLDASGNVLYSISNSSQSQDGEQASELISDLAGRTVVLYNPVIAFGNQTGSQARLIYGNEDHEVFFRNESREISHISVSDDGTLISILTTGRGEDQLFVYDRFGNELNTIGVDAGQRGAVLSDGGEFVTIFSGARIQVYRTLTGERLGSTSSRSPVVYAAYFPEDEVIVALGGTLNAGNISDPVLTSVHLTQRQIARENISATLSALPNGKVKMERQRAGIYRIRGLNQHLDVAVQF